MIKKIVIVLVILSAGLAFAQSYPPLKLKSSKSNNEFIFSKQIANNYPQKTYRVFTFYDDSIQSFFGHNKKVKSTDMKFDSSYKATKNFWIPALEVIGLNYFVWSIDHYIVKAPWANISIATVKHNLTNPWEWDSDFFTTNQFMHPYHGNLFFNFARSSGLTFWESAPYSFGGSLMWELFMEINPPAPNDLINTTMGGIAIGETLNRLSSLVIDERKTGFPRILSELGAFIIAPTKAINRFFKGEMWKVRQKSIYEIEPVASSVSVGPSYVWTNSQSIEEGQGNIAIKLDLFYGEPFKKETRKPYDFFNVKLLFGFGAQPFINQFSIRGLLFGKNYSYKPNEHMLIGAFQYFDYYNSKGFEIGAQSLGGGIVYKLPNIGVADIETSLHFGAIVLGGGSNDPSIWSYEDDSTEWRDYNYGSGFLSKFETIVSSKVGYLYLSFALYRIFNFLGADGNDQLLIIDPRIVINAAKSLNLGIEYNFYLRNSNYIKYPDKEVRVNELKFLVSTRF